MADTAQSRQRPDETFTLNERGRHVHHGRTLAAWAGSALGLVAFIVGGIAVVFQIWWLFWAAVALVVIALIATVVLQRMGYGAS